MSLLRKRGREPTASAEEGDSSVYEHIPAVSLAEYLVHPAVEQRYSAFKTARFDSKKVKKYVSARYELALSDDSALLLSTCMKLFVGEVVEAARELMTAAGREGPIPPELLTLAHLQVRKAFKGELFRPSGRPGRGVEL